MGAGSKQLSAQCWSAIFKEICKPLHEAL